MQSLVRDVKKKVQHPTNMTADGKPEKVNRIAHINLDSIIPDSVDEAIQVLNQTADSINQENKDIENYQPIDAEQLLVRAVRFAIWTYVRTQQSNNLGKADAAAKNLRKAVANLAKVMTGVSEEQIRTMLLSNPEMRAKLDSGKFETEISVQITPKDLTFPDVIASDETEETEDEDETENAPA